MGAKQSKRSVDISGKEAEGAGEVAAAGAGGEGRVEALADADALKPQLNGDAHIHEQTDKEKQLDSGTPEIEKDVTTEKESKEEDKEKEKEAVPLTNGENAEQKENGDSPAPEDGGKKPKKEKVKKKWSLRSISFSRKDKPKQEKKQKEEEPKTNGEPEKVPEEAAETTPDTPTNEVAEDTKPETENKDEKTPETPVTEPITNGSASPESSKVDTPVTDEPVAAVPETIRPEPKAEPEPEQLPVNGLSLEEPKSDVTEVTQSEESKPEEPTAETTELAPAPEIPVKKEVCVEQMPLIEPTPPPLPTNPPPSSVASFAATTMAPELTDASLSNTTVTAILSPPTILDTKADLSNENITAPKEETSQLVTNTENITDFPPPLKEVSDDSPVEIVHPEIETQLNESNESPLVEVNQSKVEMPSEAVEITPNEVINVEQKLGNINETAPETCTLSSVEADVHKIAENVVSELIEDLPPLPPVDDIIQTDIVNNVETVHKVSNVTEVTANSNLTPDVCLANDTNGVDEESLNGNNAVEENNLENQNKDLLGNVIETIECNGNLNDTNHVTKDETILVENPNMEFEKAQTTPDDSLPPSLSEANESMPAAETGDASESFPLPPSELCRSESEVSPSASPEPNGDAAADTPQEPLPMSDKIADLIPEVPVVPELKTEMETSSDVAVAN